MEERNWRLFHGPSRSQSRNKVQSFCSNVTEHNFVTWSPKIIKELENIGKQKEYLLIISSLVKWKKHRTGWSKDLDSDFTAATHRSLGKSFCLPGPTTGSPVKEGPLPLRFFSNIFRGTTITKQIKIILLLNSFPPTQLPWEASKALLQMTWKQLFLN